MPQINRVAAHSLLAGEIPAATHTKQLSYIDTSRRKTMGPVATADPAPQPGTTGVCTILEWVAGAHQAGQGSRESYPTGLGAWQGCPRDTLSASDGVVQQP